MTVDILMATYNGSHYIAEQIDSIIAQTFTQWRLLIRDDNSTDNTVELIKQYMIKDARITLVEDSKGRLGISKNFEVLILHSESEYIMFADQDDVWFNDKIDVSMKRIVELTHNNNAPTLVFTNSIIVNNDISIKYGNLYPDKLKYGLKDFLFSNSGYQGAAMIFNRTLKDIIIPFPQELRVHDFFISLLSVLQGKVDYIPEPKAYYRRHNMSVNSNNKQLKNRIKSLLAGDPKLYCQNMRNCIIKYIDQHEIDLEQLQILNNYLYITDLNNHLMKRVLLSFTNSFTLRNSRLYLILKILIIRR